MNHRLLIVILAALSMLGALSIDAYLPALPTIAHVFSVSVPAAQQTLTVYLFAFAFMMLFYGTLSDSFGRWPVIMASLVVYLISSIGGACANTLGWLMFFRLLQGLSAGAGSVVGRAMVSDLFKGAEAQRVMSYTSVVFGLAPAIAPILGGWLLSAFGWRSIFLFIALFTFVLIIVCLRSLPESLPHEQRHPFHFKVVVGHYWQVGSHVHFLLRSLGYALSFSGVCIYVASAPDFVLNQLHLSVREFGWLFIPIIGGMTLGSMVAGWISHQFTPEKIIAGGYAIMIVSALVNLLYTGLFVVTIPWAVFPMFFYGFGMAIGMPAMMVTTLEMFPKVRGMASSLQGFIFMTIFAIGSGAICPLLFGSAFKMAAGSVIGLGLSLLFWWLGNRGPKEIHPETGTDWE